MTDILDPHTAPYRPPFTGKIKAMERTWPTTATETTATPDAHAPHGDTTRPASTSAPRTPDAHRTVFPSVEIEATPSGHNTVIKLGGVDVAKGVRSYSFHQKAGEPATLELEVGVFTSNSIVAGETVTIIPKGTRDLLLHLGWTPPCIPSEDPDAAIRAAQQHHSHNQ